MNYSAFGRIRDLCSDTFAAWRESNTPRLGAALAYYTVFAIAPLILIVLGIAGMCFGEEAARSQLFGQLRSLLGNDGSKAIEAIVTSASSKPLAASWSSLAALVTLLVGVTSVFVELQDALNTIWKVERASGHGLVRFLRNRFLSFGIVVGMGFLLLISLILSAGLSAFGGLVGGFLPAWHFIFSGANFILSLGLISFMFAMILKILPDVMIAWGDVWIGGFITALLFNVGKFLMGYYLGRSSVASAFGAAGSLVIVLMWVYYSSQILFLGAQFTRVYAKKYGSHAHPVKSFAMKEDAVQP